MVSRPPNKFKYLRELVLESCGITLKIARLDVTPRISLASRINPDDIMFPDDKPEDFIIPDKQQVPEDFEEENEEEPEAVVEEEEENSDNEEINSGDDEISDIE